MFAEVMTELGKTASRWRAKCSGIYGLSKIGGHKGSKKIVKNKGKSAWQGYKEGRSQGYSVYQSIGMGTINAFGLDPADGSPRR